MPRAAALVGTLAVVATCLLSGCSDGSSNPSASSASSAPSTSTTIASTTTTHPVALVPRPTPFDAATVLMRAWAAGDRNAARTVAPVTVVDRLFAAGRPGIPESRGCSAATFSPASCVYRTAVGEVRVVTVKSGTGWVVQTARVSATG